MLVGLHRIAGHDPMPPRRNPGPACPHRMGAILDDLDPQAITQRHQRLHIDQVPAHVAQHQEAAARGLLLQVRKVDHQVFRHLDEDRNPARRRDGARHRGKGEGIGQDPLPRRHPEGPERAAQGIAARGHGQGIFRPGQGGEFLLQQGGPRQPLLRPRYSGATAHGAEPPGPASIPSSGIGSCWVNLPRKTSSPVMPSIHASR